MRQEEGLLLERKEYYRKTLLEDILPYWLGKTEPESGGFYTCYNVLGDRLLSKEKYVWSQGRCTWIYSKLARDERILMDEKMRESCRELALKGCDFLEKYCILPGDRAAFVLDENNQAKVVEPYHSKSISSFADCFAAMGLAAAGALEHNVGRIKRAFLMFEQVAEQLKNNTFRTAPDVLPEGWRSQAAYMIMINTSYELADALSEAGMFEEAESAREMCRYAINMELNHFLTEDMVLLECLGPDFEELDTLYGRHINPGHTEECMWFIIQAARWLGMEEAERTALEVIKHISRMGWDERYGGMYYYLDRDGGEPEGAFFEGEKELAEGALRDWSNKMWWPNLETVYASLMGYLVCGDERCLYEYNRYHEYTFRTFPNPDKEVGEWIQIRDRQGQPVTGTVGGRLPVKDPYHLIRTLMLLVDLINDEVG
ncbi:hypothetical protein GPL15_02325 [Clostridium sp. MCC353]|uniref:AGE family epimerase/isomerase n=1 Tax=Clostridium sp. MCC353 TaxID=2592646 RepID=UPI001C0357A4|nr:AGE family epimerase/isomerase [Clostridium sp. MCC353]MBT9775346.1 hypothetical protein [Clostridium sp. MCC353]